MPGEENPGGTFRTLDRQTVLRIGANVVEVLHWADAGVPDAKQKRQSVIWRVKTNSLFDLLVRAVAVAKDARIPAEIADVKEAPQRVNVNPEDAIVKVAGALRVKVQCRLQTGRPTVHVPFAELALPPHVRPGILEQKEAPPLNCLDVQHGIGVAGHQAGSLALGVGKVARGKGDQHVALFVAR